VNTFCIDVFKAAAIFMAELREIRSPLSAAPIVVVDTPNALAIAFLDVLLAFINLLRPQDSA